MVFPIILGVVASLIHLIKSSRFLDFCIGSTSFQQYCKIIKFTLFKSLRPSDYVYIILKIKGGGCKDILLLEVAKPPLSR